MPWHRYSWKKLLPCYRMPKQLWFFLPDHLRLAMYLYRDGIEMILMTSYEYWLFIVRRMGILSSSSGYDTTVSSASWSLGSPWTAPRWRWATALGPRAACARPAPAPGGGRSPCRSWWMWRKWMKMGMKKSQAGREIRKYLKVCENVWKPGHDPEIAQSLRDVGAESLGVYHFQPIPTMEHPSKRAWFIGGTWWHCWYCGVVNIRRINFLVPIIPLIQVFSQDPDRRAQIPPQLPNVAPTDQQVVKVVDLFIMVARLLYHPISCSVSMLW